MKLSEAIRLGSTLTPQITVCELVNEKGACALGAAGIAVGVFKVGQFSEDYKALEAVFPIPADLVCQIWCWNDVQKLTREQIADEILARGLDIEAVLPVSESIEERMVDEKVVD